MKILAWVAGCPRSPAAHFNSKAQRLQTGKGVEAVTSVRTSANLGRAYIDFNCCCHDLNFSSKTAGTLGPGLPQEKGLREGTQVRHQDQARD